MIKIRFTEWRKIADRKNYYTDKLDHDGPSVYEIGIRKRGKIKIMGVGETKNEERRMKEYGSYGSHWSKKIGKALNEGHEIYYRSQRKQSKKKAKKTQDNLLRKFCYPWNTQLNNNCK